MAHEAACQGHERHDWLSMIGYSKLLIFRDYNEAPLFHMAASTRRALNPMHTICPIAVIILHSRETPWASLGSIVSPAPGHTQTLPFVSRCHMTCMRLSTLPCMSGAAP